MTENAWVQVLVFLGLLLGLAVPLGSYLARVYRRQTGSLERLLGPVEKTLLRSAGVDGEHAMDWKEYAAAVLLFNLFGTLLVYGILRLQAHLPLNPAHLPAVEPQLAFNTAVSFATNTNWQAYAGESTLSPFSQMAALAVQNFASAATGMAVLVAFVRGFTEKSSRSLGNFWSDLTRTLLFVLLPLSFGLSLFLVGQGVVQSFAAGETVRLLEPLQTSSGTIFEQTIPLGPVASQIAIKQLGTNGGGYFNANAAHPFENPTAASNMVQMVAILLLPAALCFAFGHLVRDRRQGWAVFSAMAVLFVPLMLATIALEQAGNPLLSGLGLDQLASAASPGGNMVGKELRFGITGSSIWSVATTAASNGSVNAMHDSFTPLGGMFPLWLMQLGEIVFGGVGSGLYGLLVYAIIAVFIAGLMVGRTPEYLGKKVEASEMKMASLVILLPAATVLVGTAIASLVPGGTATLGNPKTHGFTEILYAFSSAANNNGSAFAGLGANTPFYTTALGLCMLVGRYWVIVPVLAIAGSLAKKKAIPLSPGTLPTHTGLFVGLLVGTIVLLGALTFLPSLALGPIVEHLQLHPH